MITLYDCSTAPSPRRARILLAEKGIRHETVQVDLRNGEQLGEAYRKINPQCTVPALRTQEGVILADNAAITAWAEARHPDPPLLGTTPLEKAEVASWNWRAEFEGLLAIAEAMRNTSPALANRALAGPANYAQIPELGKRGIERLQRFLVVLNERLEGRDYVAGDRFSVADLTAASLLGPIVAPSELQYQPPASVRESIARVRESFAGHPALEWTAEMFRRHRGTSAEEPALRSLRSPPLQKEG